MGNLVERASRRAAGTVRVFLPEGLGIVAFVVGLGAAAVGFCVLMCTLSS
jgi:hypothetical protein